MYFGDIYIHKAEMVQQNMYSPKTNNFEYHELYLIQNKKAWLMIC